MALNLCDTNVWLALTLNGHLHHGIARDWLESVPESDDTVLFCRATQQSLLRLLTQPAIMRPLNTAPLRNDEAWSAYDALLADDRIRLQDDEPDGIEETWRGFTSQRPPSPKLWMDAYLAAFASAASYRLVTLDTAFRQFEGLDLLLLGSA